MLAYMYQSMPYCVMNTHIHTHGYFWSFQTILVAMYVPFNVSFMDLFNKRKYIIGFELASYLLHNCMHVTCGFQCQC